MDYAESKERVQSVLEILIKHYDGIEIKAVEWFLPIFHNDSECFAQQILYENVLLQDKRTLPYFLAYPLADTPITSTNINVGRRSLLHIYLNCKQHPMHRIIINTYDIAYLWPHGNILTLELPPLNAKLFHNMYIDHLKRTLNRNT